MDNKRPRLFVEVHPQNIKIELHLRNIAYKNITNIIIKEAPETHKWTLNKLVDVNSESNISSISDLITQSYNDVLEF
ncbi:hypothetical protein [Mucilaginibacter xinganensis]|uniref:hypothetical protein n=1 Tax=Mucilaginibacter xinganensis TaxID=1234841 RepID=UPI0037446435